MKKNSRRLSILHTRLIGDRVEVEVRLVHGFFVVAEAELEEIDLIGSVGGFLGRHADGFILDRLDGLR